MSKLTRQFVAVLMLLWLPLSGAGALAATISMQAQQGDCHEAAMTQMQHDGMEAHGQHHVDDAAMQHDQADSEQGASCNACGVCHLAGSGYLAVPGVDGIGAPAPARTVTPYDVAFRSTTFTPLLPPPLVRA